ncbi:conserved hypothetical protein [Paraburkholderia unamae]|uniref:hypothetical protein n=1 Tax=Paraburkholderia unamae TaxID=219649 RepID=UPI000DC3B768|nr:hypothetical protein [Paraburkholderia unamae]RAR64922.1 hypothetical protein C7401_10438 [Paraburkholderia unamae]CAG9265960.1 conserved hypothetical protein [Paraburkholderia unamae]
MSILDRLWPRARAKQPPETPQIRALIERLLVLSPTLALVPEWRERLVPALTCSVAYVRDVVERMPPAREASAATWMNDPYIHAFFAAPDEVGHVLSRSPELHAWFESHPLAREVYAVLGMALNERCAFGAEQHGDEVHTDVMQTTLSFDDHQVRVCGETEADLREQIVQRVVEQIALEGLAQIGADESRRDVLEQERALLRTRLQLLTRHGAGTQRMFGEHDVQNAGEVARVEAQIAQNEREIAALGLKSEALEHQLTVICNVLANPAQHTNVEMREICLSPMNVLLANGSEGNNGSIVFPLARLPASPQGLRAFSLVRFARADLQPLPRVLVEDSRFMI